MSDFRLSCCRLFKQHPLVKYRTPADSGRYVLRVLLIGSGSRMNTILQEFLVGGQLLDTDLHIHYLTTNAKKASEDMLSKAPEAEKYARLFCNGTELTHPDDANVYADISYQTLAKDNETFLRTVSGLRDAGCNYVVISTGKDDKNLSLAKDISSLFGEDCVISYVQNKDTGENIDSKADMFAFSHQKDTAFLEQLEAIAYNLHYAYSKDANDRASVKEIRKEFMKPYNYVSNIEAAMHIQMKLECCGIDTSDSAAAAKAFADLMKKNPSVVNRLAALEHRRWMMEKILKGFVQVPSLDKIYHGPGVTTHDSRSDKWHTCLLPCDEVSELSLSDWKSPENASPHLDPLDRLSLDIHLKCGQVAEGNRDMIEEFLSVIRTSAERSFKDQEEILSAMHSMELAISQMWQKKKSALPIYEGNLATLLEAAAKANTYLQQSLSALNEALAPLKEFISYKDYKDQDRLLVRQIPFALTHKKQPVLMKLLAEKETDCLFTTCQTDPATAAFVCLAASRSELLNITEKISNIRRFLNQSYPSVSQEYHVIIMEKLANSQSDALADLESKNIQLHETSNIDYNTVSMLLQEIAESIKADYIDVTGAAPMLMMCAHNAGIPLIAHKSGQMMNILNAPEIEYPAPKKSITVKEMFDLSGSILIEESDSSLLSDMSSCYKKFYEIAGNEKRWDTFCRHISSEYGKQRLSVSLPAATPNEALQTLSFPLNADIANALLPVLNQLEKKGYLSCISVETGLKGNRSISFSVHGKNTANLVKERINKLIECYSPTISYILGTKDKRFVINCQNLKIKDMTLPQDSIASYKKTLDELAANNLLIGYTVDNNNAKNPKFSFQFATKDVLDVIQVSGKVLEYYLYYSALLDAHFDDVEMGWHFQHSDSADSPDNELDIICTKGNSSLFISAKNVSRTKFEDANYLKYIIYEISLLADRFGINAKPVLAIPSLEQFHLNKQTGQWEFSKEVKAAYRRGVYLLGKECFEGDVLGEIFDRIADGREDWCDLVKPVKS